MRTLRNAAPIATGTKQPRTALHALGIKVLAAAICSMFLCCQNGIAQKRNFTILNGKIKVDIPTKNPGYESPNPLYSKSANSTTLLIKFDNISPVDIENTSLIIKVIFIAGKITFESEQILLSSTDIFLSGTRKGLAFFHEDVDVPVATVKIYDASDRGKNKLLTTLPVQEI